MQLKVWGGAGEHGRSCYLLQNGDTRVMLDCGVKRAGTGEYPLLDPAEIPHIDAVFLSHAHEDHSIALPLLYKLGYRGKVWTTRITAELLPAYYAAWGRYAEQQATRLPYDETDVGRIAYAYLDEAAPALSWIELGPQLRVCWGCSGHMLGSVWLLLELAGRSFFYSGDYTEESRLLRTDALSHLPGGPVDLAGAVIDAAYGPDAEPQSAKLAQLYAAADRILAGGGQLLLPVPLSGRGQELLLLLQQQFPGVPLRVEEELLYGLEQLLRQPGAGWLRPGAEAELAAALGGLDIVRDAAQRTQLVQPGAQPGIILTGDGMMQSPKAQWYYEQLRCDPRSGIILTGHASRDTFADRLLRAPASERGCSVERIAYKIHQGLPDVRRMLQALLPWSCPAIVLAHAPLADTDALQQQLEAEGYRGLLSLRPGDVVTLA